MKWQIPASASPNHPNIPSSISPLPAGLLSISHQLVTKHLLPVGSTREQVGMFRDQLSTPAKTQSHAPHPKTGFFMSARQMPNDIKISITVRASKYVSVPASGARQVLWKSIKVIGLEQISRETFL